ncbi:MAG: hypothetical protein AB8U25_06280 [Rickettsiales endosymbiont of Dermacentor nuttalli]
MLETIKTNILLPIKSFKVHYLPIIILYFCYGFSSFTGISQMFWIKNQLSISATELAQLSFWITSPWTVKILFSQLIDNVSIMGNRRKSYIYIGALCNFFGCSIMVALSNEYGPKYLGSPYNQLLLGGILIATGFMIQDLVADTLCAELVDQNASSEDKKHEIGIIQILGRISLMLSILLATIIGGYLASHYNFSNIIWFSPILPIISITSCYFLNNSISQSESIFNHKISIISITIVIVSILFGILQIPYNQEIIFCTNLILIAFLFKTICGHQDGKTFREIILIGIMLFAARIDPTLGAGIEWWQIDVLKFDPIFFSVLKQISFMLGLIGTWTLSGYLLKKDISVIILVLTLINAILFLPYIGMAYGLHDWTFKHFGFGARTIAIVDTFIDGPFTIIIMVPILALSTLYAPKYNKPTWFAITACWLNLALSGGTLIGKYLNKIFVIERGEYNQVGNLLIAKLIIGVTIPLCTVWICNVLRNKNKININVLHTQLNHS